MASAAPPQNQTDETPHLAGSAFPSHVCAGLPASGAGRGRFDPRGGRLRDRHPARCLPPRRPVPREVPSRRRRQRRSGHDHEHGRRFQPPEIQLYGLRNNCRHIGAAVSLVLEEKTALGLAAPPDENLPMELLSESELVEHALRERQERAKNEKFRISSADAAKPWTDYTVASALSGKTYRVALRGEERGQSFCSCPTSAPIPSAPASISCTSWRGAAALYGRPAAEALPQS